VLKRRPFENFGLGFLPKWKGKPFSRIILNLRKSYCPKIARIGKERRL